VPNFLPDLNKLDPSGMVLGGKVTVKATVTAKIAEVAPGILRGEDGKLRTWFPENEAPWPSKEVPWGKKIVGNMVFIEDTKKAGLSGKYRGWAKVEGYNEELDCLIVHRGFLLDCRWRGTVFSLAGNVCGQIRKASL